MNEKRNDPAVQGRTVAEGGCAKRDAPGRSRPLVSVVTGTWRRHEDLIGAIETVRAQTYRPIEHVIVSDGPDDELAYKVWTLDRTHRSYTVDKYDGNDDDYVPIKFVELGRNWSTYLTNSHSVAPFMVAQFMAAGEYQCWLSDDERMTPDHVESLVDFLEEGDEDGPYDFVSPLVEVYYATKPDVRWVVGQDPPENGTITHCLYRTRLLDVGGFRPHVGSGSDWDQVERWLDSGARFGLMPRVTFSHRSDFMNRKDSTPLREGQSVGV